MAFIQFLLKFSIRARLFFATIITMIGLGLLFGLHQYGSIINEDLNEALVQVAKMESGMLTLRRNEKDFLARHDLKYQDKFNNNLNKTLQTKEILTEDLEKQGLDAGKAYQVQEVLKQYADIFNALVATQEEIGLDHKSGLYGALRSSVHDIEEVVKAAGDDRLLADMLMLRRREKDFMLRWDMKYLDKFNKDVETFKSHLVASNHSADFKADVNAKMDKYQSEFHAFVQGMQKLGLSSKEGMLGEMRDTVHKTETLLKELEEEISVTLHNRHAEVETAFTLINVVTALIVIGIILIITFSIVTPLSALSGLVRKIAETRDLSLRCTANGKDEVADMGQALNQLMESFSGSMQEVFQASNELQQASQELEHVTNALSDGVQRQQAETDMVATAMNEMTATVQEVARNAQEAAAASHSADGQAVKGRQLVDKSVSGIEEMANEVESTAAEIETLQAESENISTVLDVIGSIAEQTNLLALNAAIEAARAGEQGRGFAVVADEVRALASRSHDATGEIRQIIERLQGSAASTSAAMQHVREKASECVNDASVAGQSIDEIAQQISSITDQNTQIASASEQQSAVSEEINQNVVNIRDIAMASTESSHETMATSQRLSALSDSLTSVISKFKGH
ncbi:MAG: methyl-accepting chemotaxis protein [Gammaproteobacteria bacterium]|nr:methyl-accepting chemotaxis protein [Gammaproteobacteria bacterium]